MCIRDRESEGAHDNIEKLRELLQLEQFNTCLDSDLRSWLLDQKPKNNSEAARLADQRVAIHTAGRPGSRDWKQRQPHQGGSPHSSSRSRLSHRPLVLRLLGRNPSTSHPVLKTGQRSPSACKWKAKGGLLLLQYSCLLYTSPSPRDGLLSRMPSSA